MIRTRLKEIDIKITELSDYLKITRPTLYKFIDAYDAGDRDSINKKVISLFDYIESNTLAGRNTVLNYILNHLVLEKELGDESDVVKYNKVKKFMLDNPNDYKTKFIETIVNKNYVNLIVEYLVKIEPILKKRKLTAEEEQLLEAYNQVLEKIQWKEK